MPVCKRFREIYCSQLKKFTIPASLLNELSCVSYMFGLRDLKIKLSANCNFKDLCIYLQELQTNQLQMLTISGTNRAVDVEMLSKAIAHLRLRGLIMPDISVSFCNLKIIANELQTLRYLILPITLDDMKKRPRKLLILPMKMLERLI